VAGILDKDAETSYTNVVGSQPTGKSHWAFTVFIGERKREREKERKREGLKQVLMVS
jgi:hypothetical protein